MLSFFCGDMHNVYLSTSYGALEKNWYRYVHRFFLKIGVTSGGGKYQK